MRVRSMSSRRYHSAIPQLLSRPKLHQCHDAQILSRPKLHQLFQVIPLRDWTSKQPALH